MVKLGSDWLYIAGAAGILYFAYKANKPLTDTLENTSSDISQVTGAAASGSAGILKTGSDVVKQALIDVKTLITPVTPTQAAQQFKQDVSAAKDIGKTIVSTASNIITPLLDTFKNLVTVPVSAAFTPVVATTGGKSTYIPPVTPIPSYLQPPVIKSVAFLSGSNAPVVSNNSSQSLMTGSSTNKLSGAALFKTYL